MVMDREGGLTKKDRVAIISFQGIAKRFLNINMWFIIVGVLALAITSIVTFLMGVVHFCLIFNQGYTLAAFRGAPQF